MRVVFYFALYCVPIKKLFYRTEMGTPILLLGIILGIKTASGLSGHVHNAVETEMFAIPISPNLFNWTYQGLFYLVEECICRH